MNSVSGLTMVTDLIRGIAPMRNAFVRGSADPRDILTHFFERIDRYNPALNAFLELDRRVATEAARESAERFGNDTQRPLEGIPIAVKANIAVKGLVHSAGMAARSDLIAEDDAKVVAQLRQAGAVILGTLNMDEASLGALTVNAHFGDAFNPHGRDRSPGGSSGGPGAAVAAGLCMAALGSDTVGSIRIPAAHCGVFGLRPSPGVVATEGLVSFSESFDVIGPLARSLDDLSYIVNLVAAPDLSTAMQRSRFFVLGDAGDALLPEDSLAVWKQVMSALTERATLLDLPFPCARISYAVFMLSVRELVKKLVEMGEEKCSMLSDPTVRMIELGLSRSEADLEDDRAIVEAVRKTFEHALGPNGILLTMTTPRSAPLQGGIIDPDVAGLTALASAAGLPALTLPCGKDAQGMPLGLQLIGPAGSEALLIAQGRMLQDRLRGYFPPAGFELYN
jgi:aspartyl-tRNA(Asn)/glutamyl-tRNA(Gln) amidotransferase subunit A